MKTKYLLIFIVSTCIIFFSCQKAFTPEDNFTSAGTLNKDAGGNCAPISINGIFKAGVALAATNFIDVSVNVTATGSYSISSDTLNGIYFSASGDFTATGTQTVRLTGNGTPVSAGITAITVHYGASSSCAVLVTVVPAGPSVAAVFTLIGAPGACTAPVIHGIYTAGTALNPSNKLVVEVNVTSIGDYTLSTAMINGISFAAIGSFVTTGLQTVTLAGSGTPLIAGTNSMTVSGTAAGCSFPLTVGTVASSGTYLAAAYYIDTTLAAPFDTVARLYISYDAQNRVASITEFDTKPNGDSSFYEKQTFFYTGNDTLANKRIDYNRDFYTLPPDVGGETNYYTFSNGRMISDSAVYNPTNYSVERLSYNGTTIQRTGTSFSSGTFYHNYSNINQTVVNGNITYQLDTLVSYQNFPNPNTNHYQREEISVSYLPNPNPFYQIRKCALQPYYYDQIGIDAQAAPRNLMSQENEHMIIWNGTNPPGTNRNNQINYIYTFRPDGYPVEARVTIVSTGNPTERYKLIFVYR